MKNLGRESEADGRDDVMGGLVRNTKATPIRSQETSTDGYEMKIGINCIGLIHRSH